VEHPVQYAVAVGSAVAHAPSWAQAVGCLAVLAALEAAALRFGRQKSLESYLARTGTGDEPGWWPEFERGFRRYIATEQSGAPRHRVPR
jgi:hypothetical protein